MRFRLTEELLVEIAAAAQRVYDDWEQDADGESEEYGAGGICDDVADAMADELISAGFDVATHHYEQDNHTVVILLENERVYEVNIPLHVYETGSWYTYRKIPGVQFGPGHISIIELPESPLEQE